MYLIRRTEEAIIEHYPEEKMRTPVHLSIGQEAAAVGVMMALEPSDHVYSNHRCHAHYLAKGGNLDAMIAELYGKVTGCAGGRGGSMHLIDEPCGFMGTSAIVGSSIPVALGSAMAFKRENYSFPIPIRVAVAFFGDAALETGVLYESINFAALHQLPIIFVCENNGYATQIPLNQRQPEQRGFGGVAGAMGIVSYYADDWQGVEEVYKTALRARANVPSYLEIKTYRYREHVGMDYDWDLGYRTREEVEAQMAHDPLLWLREDIKELFAHKGEAFTVPILEIENELNILVSEAFQKAEGAPWPA